MQILQRCSRGDRRLSDNKWDASCLWRPLRRATVENGTKIWSVNLRLNTFQCLIFLLLHFTIKRMQICILHSPLWGINQYFLTYSIGRAAGFNIRYAKQTLGCGIHTQEGLSRQRKRSHRKSWWYSTGLKDHKRDNSLFYSCQQGAQVWATN